MNRRDRLIKASAGMAALAMSAIASEAHATDYHIRLPGWTAGGLGCETSVNIMPVGAYTVSGI